MVELWQHQKDIVQFAYQNGKSLIYAGMGTGKTLAALCWLWMYGGLRLVVTPKPALSVWAEDYKNLLDKPPFTLVTLDYGTVEQKAKYMMSALPNQDIVFVTNYETARLLPLQAMHFNAVVLDECHRIGQHNSKQTLSLTKRLVDVPYKMLMTGTPYHDGPHKVYSIERFLHPKILVHPKAHPVSRTFQRYSDFLYQYAHTYDIAPGVQGIREYKNLDQLGKKLAPFTIKINAEDVLDLPPVVERMYKAAITGQTAKAYKAMAKDGMVEIDDMTMVAPHLLTKLIRLQQLATSGSMRTDTGVKTALKGIEGRIKVLSMILETIPDQPVVIFTNFVRDVELITELLDEKPALLTGEVDTHQDWKAGKYRVLIANMGAGSEGVRLERASHAIFWSVGYSAGDYHQARARLHRAGQKAGTVSFYQIVSAGTIDEDIYETLHRKDIVRDQLDGELSC
jgi:SNF2 family DNA or RNA helicase